VVPPSWSTLLKLGGSGSPNGFVEGGQVAFDVRVVVGVHDGDGLAGAVAHGVVAEGDLVEAIRVADLGGAEAGRREQVAGLQLLEPQAGPQSAGEVEATGVEPDRR
jgi:hypothetical protein